MKEILGAVVLVANIIIWGNVLRLFLSVFP